MGGAAGAWMFNGCLQVLNSGLVPGNRNADNVDKVMEKFDYIVYPSQSIQTDGIKAFSVTSFGFGQKGAQAIGIHPKYLFATLDHAQFQTYKQKVEARQKKTYRYYHDGLINNTMFRAKDKSPYDDSQLSQVFLNPEARVTSDKKTSVYSYPKVHPSPNSNPGVDIESIDAIDIATNTFVERNFTDAEVAYCRKAPNQQASFTGKWSAKEAVFKSLKVQSRGAGAPLKDIEIVNDESGAPVVTLH